MDTIKFSEFQRLDIRIGTIKSAEKVEGADKLLKLSVDLGGETRTLAAGIAQFYRPEELVGRQLPVLMNLEAKIFKGIESKGMILAADNDGRAVLLNPDKKVPNGSMVK